MAFLARDDIQLMGKSMGPFYCLSKPKNKTKPSADPHSCCNSSCVICHPLSTVLYLVIFARNIIMLRQRINFIALLVLITNLLQVLRQVQLVTLLDGLVNTPSEYGHYDSHGGALGFDSYDSSRSDQTYHALRKGVSRGVNATGASRLIQFSNGEPFPKAKHFDQDESLPKSVDSLSVPQSPARQENQVFQISTPSIKLPKPIMVVGFPKAGTSSIFNFFKCSGLKSMHWYCCGDQVEPQTGGPHLMASCMLKNVQRGLPILYKCGHYDLFAELNGPRKRMYNESGQPGYLLDDGTYDFQGPGNRLFFPQHHYINELHQQYPNATFILNLRPVDEWVDSVLRWGDDLATQILNEYHVQSNGNIELPKDSIELTKTLTLLFEEHSEMIRNFVRKHPSHSLVEVDVSDSRAGEVLADAFGLDEKCWQQMNKNAENQTLDMIY
jgi:hypothetical protein